MLYSRYTIVPITTSIQIQRLSSAGIIAVPAAPRFAGQSPAFRSDEFLRSSTIVTFFQTLNDGN